MTPSAKLVLEGTSKAVLGTTAATVTNVEGTGTLVAAKGATVTMADANVAVDVTGDGSKDAEAVQRRCPPPLVS